MKNCIATLLLSCIPLLSFCQDYVINLQGDTLRGTVRIITMDPIDQVRVTVDKKKTNLTALKARTIFLNQETYNSVRNGQTQKFMKLIKPGFLSLYGFKLPNQTQYDGLFLVKKSGQSMEVPNLGFKKLMMAFLSECEPVTDALEEETLKRKDLNDIIDKFNTCSDLLRTGGDTGVRPLASYDNDKKIGAVDAFKKKVDALETFSVKKDVLDILSDIREKLEKQESIPSYLYGVLKSHLANQPAMTEDLEKLIALLSAP